MEPIEKRALLSGIVGKAITGVALLDLYETDYEELVLTFSDGTSIKLTGTGSSCGTAGYLEIETPPTVRDIPTFDPLLWQMA